MKQIGLKAVFAFLICVSAAWSQDNISMSYFQGGAYQIRFHVASSLFSGVGLRSEGLAGVVSTLNQDPASIVRHPAALTRLKQALVTLDLTPPIQIDPAAYMDMDASIQSGVNNAIADYNVPAENIAYPVLDIRFGQAGIGGSGGAVIPTRYGFVGLAVYRPFTLSLDLIGNGFATMIETSKEIGDKVTVVQFAAQMNPTVRFRLNTTAAALSYGWSLGQKFAIGATLDWLTAKVDLNAFFKLDGIMLLRQEGAVAGQEYAFNDPYDESIRWEDGEQNTLDQWAIGSYQGSGWGATLSALYQPGQTLSFDFSVSLMPTLSMKGNMSFVQNMIPAVAAENFFSDDPNASLFDVTQLNLAKPTLTRRFENPTDTVLVLEFPTSITLGVSKKLGRRSLVALNYNIYSGKLGYRYLKYQQGLKFKQGVRFGLMLPMAWFLGPETILLKLLGQEPDPTFRFGFGAIFADEVKAGFPYLENTNKIYVKTGMIIPSFSMAKSFTIVQNVETDVLFVALPASFFKMSFLYRF